MMKRICAWCKRDMGESMGPDGAVTHGICPACAAKEEGLRADHFEVDGKHFATIFRAGYPSIDGPRRDTVVEAIMALDELLDRCHAAILRMSDVVLTEDMSASLAEMKAAEARAKATAGITEPERVLVYDLGGPDGPVADSVDGYKVTAEEIRAETGEEPREIPPGKLPSGEDAPDQYSVRVGENHQKEGA